MSNDQNLKDIEFEELMKLRSESIFSANPDGGIEIADERLKEMSKKLPEWSLEPPSTFLR